MMRTLKRWGVMRLAVTTLALAAVALGLMMRQARAPAADEWAGEPETPAPAAEALENGARIRPTCAVIQTMGFSRCGHSVTRRVNAPAALVGGDFAAVQSYYDLWQIEACTPEQITMSREIPLYCPMHQVLAVNEAGEIVLTHNAYGDGMAVVTTYPLSVDDLSPDAREALLAGKGFASREEAETWLASVR